MSCVRTAFVAALFISLNSGCYLAKVSSRGTPGYEDSETGVSLFWGLTSTKTQAFECEYGLQSVSTYFPWYSWLLSGVTLGIVTPIVKSYTCNATPPRL